MEREWLRKRIQTLTTAITNSIERRIVARPFSDTQGEKGLWAWLAHSLQHQVTYHKIAIAGWPKVGRDLRIAFLSDLHTGSHTGDLERLDQILDDTARLLPDLVCFGGDYTNGMLFGRGRVPPEVIASKLARLKPPLGTFAVLGDHDQLFGAERITRSLHETGVDVLVNDTRSLLFEGWTIYLVGVSPDANALQSLLDHLPPGSATVILAHDPAAFARMPKGPHLMLCGHTHGGQIRLPIVGPLVNMSEAPLRWTYGHIVEEGRHLCVTSGVGTSGLPLRIGVAPEIALIEVGFDDNPAFLR
jgi:uncharacterized protein